MTWTPITRHGRRIESPDRLRPLPRSRQGTATRAQPVPLTILIEAAVPSLLGTSTVAVIRQPPYIAPAPAARYVPSTLVLALLRHQARGWQWWVLAEATLRHGTR